MLQAFWKQFAESVTDFAYKYRHDVFYRTGWNVVILQIGFASVLLAIVFVSLSLLYDEILHGLIDSITQSLATGASPDFDSISIATNLEYEKLKNMIMTATGILVSAVVFSWLITRIALRPTQNVLENQKQFVGNIAHELRTPLSIIKTNTEVALFDERLSKDMQETLTSNIEELDRISQIINNLLSMSSLLRPEKMEFSNIDILSVIDRVVSVLADLSERKSIPITVKKSAQRMVWGNAAALEQIITNIVKNALNYTPNGGKVTISVETNYLGQIELRVEDTGEGIAEKDFYHVFEPFYRGDASRNRKSGGGSGLGLAIVSELVKIHKGSILIRSAVGRGTTVIVTLPPGHSKKEKRGTDTGESIVTMNFSSEAKGA